MSRFLMRPAFRQFGKNWKNRPNFKDVALGTGGPSSSCEMIILRNNGHGGIIRVCMGIFTTALRNKKIRQILKKNTSPRFHIFLFLVVPFIPASDADVVQHFTGYSITYCKWYSTVKSFQEYSCFASLISGPRYGELFRTCSCSPLVAVESTPLELPGRYNGHRTTIRLAEE